MSSVQRKLPSGTVTFFLTDIEGSTKLLRELGSAAYGSALREHRRIVRASIQAHGGVEVDTQGDAFLVVFPTASGAIAAAAATQESLAAGPIRVRIGIHTGAADLTEDGYVGEELHRAARIAAAGHGGQVLLSGETRALVGIEPTDLGEHRVKDFADPVWIFQLGAERFPPLRTISNTNLPHPASTFVGRQRELSEVTALLENGARLVTLAGAGGSGKTRLAIEAAAELVPRFKNGVFWVGLAAVREPSLVLGTIAGTLGAAEDLAGHIAERELLLLLDNFEQVVDAAPGLGVLLAACPNLRMLVTSRELLRIQGEVVHEVQPLTESEAVELFCLRSQHDSDHSIADLCRRLDNLPLAIELAAARTSVLSPAQILSRLGQRLDLLKGDRDKHARQQTLRMTIEWSYDLLAPAERQLFARLAVFRGGCTLESAEQVAAADLDVLQALVDKSLLRHAGERFWMLETIREYALERLDGSGEGERMRSGHAGHIASLVRAAGPRLAGTDPQSSLDRIDAELNNVRSVLDWAYGAGRMTFGVEIAAALERFWWIRAPAEGLAWLERGLAESELAPELRGAALAAAGGAAYFVGEIERAISIFYEGLELYRMLGERAGIARMLARLGPPLFVAGRIDEGGQLVAQAVALNRELGNTSGLIESLHILAGAARERGDLEKARELFEESTALARETGDSVWVGWNLFNLADVALRRSEPARAWSLSREALSEARAHGDGQVALNCLAILSVAAAMSRAPWQAGVLWGAMERLDAEVGRSLWRLDRARYEELLGERSGDFERGTDRGLALTLDEALAVSADDPIDN